MHVITGLTRGGAEVVLCRLQEQFASRFPSLEQQVVILGRTDPHLLGRLKSTGVEVVLLGGVSRASFPLLAFKLYGKMRSFRPDVIQGWMYDANLASLLGKCFIGGGSRVYWNIRHSFHSADNERFGLRMVIWLNKLLSRLTTNIIFNSHTSLEQHVALGFAANRAVVIPNGFDPNSYRPDGGARDKVRAALGIPENAVVFANVARLHPMKGQRTLLEAFAQLASVQDKPLHLVFIGGEEGVTAAELKAWAESLSVAERVHVLGLRNDLAALYCGMDVVVCASHWGEAFPNAIGEAMACGVPCIVTDLGDAALLLGDGGVVIPPEDTQSLSGAMQQFYDMETSERHAIGSIARQRVIERWSLTGMAVSYYSLYSPMVTEASEKGEES